MGYGVIKLNAEDGKMRYGDYKLDLHEGPIYVEEVDKHPLNGNYIWVSINLAGSIIHPMTPPVTQTSKVVIDKYNTKFKVKPGSQPKKEEVKDSGT